MNRCVCCVCSAIASGSFERVCVLFNIAAMQSQIAETQNIGSDDGRKTAAKLFQVSCVVIRYRMMPCLQFYTLNLKPKLSWEHWMIILLELLRPPKFCNRLTTLKRTG